jgi:hypothetical protein
MTPGNKSPLFSIVGGRGAPKPKEDTIIPGPTWIQSGTTRSIPVHLNRHFQLADSRTCRKFK